MFEDDPLATHQKDAVNYTVPVSLTARARADGSCLGCRRGLIRVHSPVGPRPRLAAPRLRGSDFNFEFELVPNRRGSLSQRCQSRLLPRPV